MAIPGSYQYPGVPGVDPSVPAPPPVPPVPTPSPAPGGQWGRLFGDTTNLPLWLRQLLQGGGGATWGNPGSKFRLGGWQPPPGFDATIQQQVRAPASAAGSGLFGGGGTTGSGGTTASSTSGGGLGSGSTGLTWSSFLSRLR